LESGQLVLFLEQKYGGGIATSEIVDIRRKANQKRQEKTSETRRIKLIQFGLKTEQ